jgi:hypothetical protein
MNRMRALAHAERYRQGERIRRATAVCLVDNDRHRADHQSCELREHYARRIRGRHRRGSVSLFDQSLTQVRQASVTGLEPKRPYVLALSDTPDGKGALEPLAAFTTNPAGAAIVNALGPIRQIVHGESNARIRIPAQGPQSKGGPANGARAVRAISKNTSASERSGGLQLLPPIRARIRPICHV